MRGQFKRLILYGNRASVIYLIEVRTYEEGIIQLLCNNFASKTDVCDCTNVTCNATCLIYCSFKYILQRFVVRNVTKALRIYNI